MADFVNFKVIQGDTFKIIVTYKDSAGDPVPLYNYDAISQVRDEFGGKVLCAESTVGDGIELVYDDGQIILEFSPAKTKKFTVPRAALQLQIIDPDGKKKTLIKSYISVEKSAIQDV